MNTHMYQDWRVETLIYQDSKQLRASQGSFVPRIGELVFFHRGKIFWEISLSIFVKLSKLIHLIQVSLKTLVQYGLVGS